MKTKYCPNCSKKLEGDNSSQEYETNDKLVGYDTYCDNCGWSGNIEPDEKLCLNGE